MSWNIQRLARDPMFSCHIELLIGDFEWYQARLVKKYHVDGDELESLRFSDGASGMISNVTTGFHVFYIWLRDWDCSIRDYSNLAHELSHHVDKMVDATGVNDGETRAYYMSMMYEKVVRILIREWRKRNERQD